jgi:hypothetical protein
MVTTPPLSRSRQRLKTYMVQTQITEKYRDVRGMSALPQIADIRRPPTSAFDCAFIPEPAAALSNIG